jgi:hypothetical protein
LIEYLPVIYNEDFEPSGLVSFPPRASQMAEGIPGIPLFPVSRSATEFRRQNNNNWMLLMQTQKSRLLAQL